MKRRGMSMYCNNRGQFYLLAAVILSTVIIGIATISNYAKKNQNTKIYDMKKELKIEGENVLDYGTNQGFSESEMKDLVQNFTINYINYSSEGNSYFIFGKPASMRLVAFQEDAENFSISSSYESFDTDIIPREIYVQDFGPLGNDKAIRVTINGFTYIFVASDVQNFFFILSQKSEGGTYIVTG